MCMIVRMLTSDSCINRTAGACLLTFSLLLSACATVAPQRDRPADLALEPEPAGQWHNLERLDHHNSFVPMNKGSTALDWRLRALRGAGRSIDLQTFIWEDDLSGRSLTREILAAADRGVKVRVILDDAFLTHGDPVLRALSEHPLISYRVYNPLAYRAENPALRGLESLEEFSRINHRMHNKLLLVDGRVAVVGGRNQADEYFGYRDDHNFRDFELIIHGPFVAELSGAFDLYWNDPWSIPVEDLVDAELRMSSAEVEAWLDGVTGQLEKSGPASAEDWLALFESGHRGTVELIVDSPADDSPAIDLPVQLANAYIKRIDSTQRDLLLVSAYFIPTTALTEAIERAVARGVRVRILTNSLGSNNHIAAHAAYALHRPALLQAGAELYELRADASTRALYTVNGGSDDILGLHAKLALFDDCCLLVGSSNLDPRSLRLNTEIAALVDSPGLNSHLRELLAVDLLPANAWQVKLKDANVLVWTGPDGEEQTTPPASFIMRAESWFFGLLPIEDQM